MLVRFLVWLPDSLFVLMVKALVKITNVFYLAAKEESRRQKAIGGMSVKNMLALCEALENNR